MKIQHDTCQHTSCSMSTYVNTIHDVQETWGKSWQFIRLMIFKDAKDVKDPRRNIKWSHGSRRFSRQKLATFHFDFLTLLGSHQLNRSSCYRCKCHKKNTQNGMVNVLYSNQIMINHLFGDIEDQIWIIKHYYYILLIIKYG